MGGEALSGTSKVPGEVSEVQGSQYQVAGVSPAQVLGTGQTPAVDTTPEL